MKYFAVLLCLGIPFFLAGGCKKKVDAPNIIICVSPPGLDGDWELRETQASITPVKTSAANNGTIIRFTGLEYRFISGGQVTKSGRFLLMNDTTTSATNVCLNSPQGYARIVYDSNFTAQKVFLKLMDKKLEMLTGCMAVDGHILTTYERITP